MGGEITIIMVGGQTTITNGQQTTIMAGEQIITAGEQQTRDGVQTTMDGDQTKAEYFFMSKIFVHLLFEYFSTWLRNYTVSRIF